MIQSIAKLLGENGCYFFCILKRFGREYDALKLYEDFLKKGYLEKDCYLVRPDLIAEAVSGQKWTVRKESKDYVCKPGEWEVQRWERKTPGLIYNHFVLPDWDPLGTSMTRVSGVLESKRIFKEVG